MSGFEFWVGEDDEEALYQVVEGADQKWIRGSEEPLVYVIKRSVDDEETFERFEGIEMDGETVDPAAYTVEAGSVRITLPASYLESLDNGMHDIDVIFNDGLAGIRLSIRSEDEEEDEDEEPGADDDGGDEEDEEEDEETSYEEGDVDPEIDGEEPITPPPVDASEKASTETADTGDASHTMIWVSLIGLSILGLCIVGFLKIWFGQKDE